jgi:membrane protease YdiL (CAAX protease family)
MQVWIDRIFLLAITVFVAVLAATSLPVVLGEGHLDGLKLLLHMMASGGLVVVLPLYALHNLTRATNRKRSGGLQRLGFWLLMLAGLVSIGTMFLCMLPLASTEQMHQLVELHRYAGFAAVAAVVLLLIGTSRWRRIQATRSATPG